jgi:hypothetical protein
MTLENLWMTLAGNRLDGILIHSYNLHIIGNTREKCHQRSSEHRSHHLGESHSGVGLARLRSLIYNRLESFADQVG